MIKGFKEFVFRGNVIDLAVAVAVGTALAALVAAVTQALIEPIVGWILSLIGGSDGIGGTITLSQGYELNFALLIGAVITFFVTLAALYLFFVAPASSRASAKKCCRSRWSMQKSSAGMTTNTAATLTGWAI